MYIPMHDEGTALMINLFSTVTPAGDLVLLQ